MFPINLEQRDYDIPSRKMPDKNTGDTPARSAPLPRKRSSQRAVTLEGLLFLPQPEPGLFSRKTSPDGSRPSAFSCLGADTAPSEWLAFLIAANNSVDELN